MTFHPYHISNRDDFYNLNISWLKELFLLEPYDEYVLSNPKRAILDKGGYIFVGKLNERVVATFALTPSDVGVYELNKMTVHASFRGKGYGNNIMEFLIQFCIKKNMNVIELYSNKELENAIHLYSKYGFLAVDLPKLNPYQRADIKMTLTLNKL